jgi:hypothetical protein
MNVEQFVEWRLAGETQVRVLGKNPPDTTSSTISQKTWPGIEFGLPQWEADDLPPELWHDLPNCSQILQICDLSPTSHTAQASPVIKFFPDVYPHVRHWFLYLQSLVSVWVHHAQINFRYRGTFLYGLWNSLYTFLTEFIFVCWRIDKDFSRV